MFDIAWSEMALIVVVALIVIGPKDLPRVARTAAKWTAKARAMARQFQRSVDDMVREADLQDIKTELDKLSGAEMRHRLEKTIDPEGELRRGLAAPATEPPRPEQQPVAETKNSDEATDQTVEKSPARVAPSQSGPPSKPDPAGSSSTRSDLPS